MSCRGLNHYFFHIYLLSKTEDVNVAGERPQIYSYATAQGIFFTQFNPPCPLVYIHKLYCESFLNWISMEDRDRERDM